MVKQNYFEELILRTHYNSKQYRGKKEQIQNEDKKEKKTANNKKTTLWFNFAQWIF